MTIAAWVTVLCLILAYPIAHVLTNARPTVRIILAALIILPYFIAVLVRTYALMIVLGTRGPINEALLELGLVDQPMRLLFTRGAVIIAMTLVLLPMMVLPLYSVMSRIDQNLIRAGQALGASPAAAFWAILVPLSLPGALAGVVLVFVVALGLFITPSLVGGAGDRVLAMDIAQQSTQLTSEGFTEALGVILLVSTIGILAVASRFVRFDVIWSIVPPGSAEAGRSDSSGARVSRGARRATVVRNLTTPILRLLDRVPTGVGMSLAWVVTLGAAVAAVIPILLVVLLSFTDASFLRFPPTALSMRWYEEFLASESWTQAAINSVVIGVLTAIGALVIGTLAALGLARARVPGKSLVVALLLSPLIVPAVVGALSLYWVIIRLDVRGSILLVAAAHALGAIPMVVIIVAATYQTFDERLELAARIHGSSPWQAVRLVTLPLIRPGLVAAALFAFLYSFDELVHTLFIREPGLVTLPIKLWGDLNFGLTPILAVVSSLEIIVVVSLVAIAVVVQRRRQEPGPEVGPTR